MRKKSLGRKPLPKGQHRVLMAARVAPDTAKFFRGQDMELGRWLDMLARKEMGKQEAENPRETSYNDAKMQAADTILESARGLLALIHERGTNHLSQEEIALLDDNFTLLTNNFLVTLKKKKK